MLAFLAITTIVVYVVCFVTLNDGYSRISEAVWLSVLAASIWFLVGICIIGGIAHANLSTKCLSLGWPETKMTWNLQGYCVARTDQTDVVVPVGEAKRR